MRASRFSEAQIIGILREHEAGGIFFHFRTFAVL